MNNFKIFITSIFLTTTLNATIIIKTDLQANAYAIKLGVFGKKDNAYRLSNSINEYSVYIVKTGTFYNVYIVNIDTLEYAKKMLSIIKKRFPSSFITKNSKIKVSTKKVKKTKIEIKPKPLKKSIPDKIKSDNAKFRIFVSNIDEKGIDTIKKEFSEYQSLVEKEGKVLKFYIIGFIDFKSANLVLHEIKQRYNSAYLEGYLEDQVTNQIPSLEEIDKEFEIKGNKKDKNETIILKEQKPIKKRSEDREIIEIKKEEFISPAQEIIEEIETKKQNNTQEKLIEEDVEIKSLKDDNTNEPKLDTNTILKTYKKYYDFQDVQK